MRSPPLPVRAQLRSAPMFVLGVWAVMTGVAFWFVGRYGRDCPFADDWELLSIPNGWLWVFSPHRAHWLILPKLLWLASYRTTHSYLTIPYVCVVLSSLTSLTLISASRRGWSDVLYPAALLSLAHWENWIGCNYCSQFVISSCLVALLPLFPVAATLLLPICGVNGWVFAPLGIYLLA